MVRARFQRDLSRATGVEGQPEDARQEQPGARSGGHEAGEIPCARLVVQSGALGLACYRVRFIVDAPCANDQAAADSDTDQASTGERESDGISIPGRRV